MLDRIFVNYSVQKLNQSAGRIDSCLGKLTEQQVWARGSTNENAVGNLVLHVCGNVRQWIVSGAGAAPDSRDRDAEFAATGGPSILELRSRLAATVAEGCSVIRSLSAERLEARILVQSYDLTVLEAVYHVIEHFSGHTGQIIFATKLFTGEDLGFYPELKASTLTARPR
jgi:uncharacterized damage-inducible protein DinB